jgi:hypothetical protein
MFKRKPEPQPLSLREFSDQLAALVAKAIASRIHLVDISNSLANRKQDVDFRHAQRPII